jgi:hypothetical protein
MCYNKYIRRKKKEKAMRNITWELLAVNQYKDRPHQLVVELHPDCICEACGMEVEMIAHEIENLLPGCFCQEFFNMKSHWRIVHKAPREIDYMIVTYALVDFILRDKEINYNEN